MEKFLQLVGKNVDGQSLFIVLLGGLIGGLLQPAVASFTPGSDDVALSSWFLGPILGAAAAGIAVFVVANSNTEEKLRLLFFSLLCGIAFPSVLSSAVEQLDQRSLDAINDAEAINAAAAKGSDKQAAEKLTETILKYPSGSSLEPEAQERLEASAQQVVSSLGEKANKNDPAAEQAVDQLRQIGTAAKAAGYDGTALHVTEQLTRIEQNAADSDPVKGQAAQAAQDVIVQP
jgi:hypothetical protein